MTTITINDKELIISVEGLDKLLAFKGYVTIPLEHVQKVERNPEPLMKARYAVFGIGTIFAGKIQAGTFSEHGEKSFWDVRNPKKALLITLKDDTYSKLVIEVENPDETIKQIQTKIGQSHD